MHEIVKPTGVTAMRRGLIALVALLFAVPFSSAAPSWVPGDDCVGDTGSELTGVRASVGPQLDTITYLVPGGTTSDLVLHAEYATIKDKPYFAAVQDIGTNKLHTLGRSSIGLHPIPNDSTLVSTGLANRTDTLVTIAIPDAYAGLWRSTNLYVYRCESPDPTDISHVKVHLSKSSYSSAIVWLVLFCVYAIAALSARIADGGSYRWYRYFDPVVLTAGFDGKGSLSTLQVLFFTMIVFGLVSYIVLRTGILTDLSSTILLLLGIAGVGSTAAKATDAQRNKLSFDNWSWLVRKNWLPPGGLAATNRAEWHDIFTTDDQFDVYRFQSFVFSAAVGVALFASGVTELASFQIPDTFLGILGLSQVVYVGGKLVTTTTVADLDGATKELSTLERQFVDAAWGNANQAPASVGPPTTLAAAKARAGDKVYNDYMNKAASVALLISRITGNTVPAQDLEPAIR